MAGDIQMLSAEVNVWSTRCCGSQIKYSISVRFLYAVCRKTWNSFHTLILKKPIYINVH